MLRPQRELPAHRRVHAHLAPFERAPGLSIAGASALELARAYADGALSPTDVVTATLERIEKVNPSVNAFVWTRERSLADARAADDRFARASRGRGARALEGVPFTVKDLCAIEDGPTTMGSRAFEGFSYGRDAEIVKRLRAAGAILVATTASSEFGNRPTTESDLYGATRNPWNLERTSGGSSGGAAVSAALGVAPLNQASDGGGSIRIPAACCGVFGLKPQRARIPLAPFMHEEWGGLDVYGPITRTVGDAALFMDVTAGRAPGDPYWVEPPRASFLSACDEEPRLRIAVAYERDGEAVNAAMKQAVRETADLLTKLGHQVDEAAPDLMPLQDGFLVLSTVGIGQKPLTDEQLAKIEPRTRMIFEAATHVPAVDYVSAMDRMHRAGRDALAFFETYDVLLTPTVSRPAPVIGEIGATLERAWDDYRNWLCWTWPFNVTGQPAASVPAGFGGGGLPLGVQIVGRPADERTVLAVSAQIERARPWATDRPPLW